jgi:hypothetical protein
VSIVNGRYVPVPVIPEIRLLVELEAKILTSEAFVGSELLNALNTAVVEVPFGRTPTDVAPLVVLVCIATLFD